VSAQPQVSVVRSGGVGRLLRAALFLVGMVSFNAMAQGDFPNQTIRFVTGYPAGLGGADSVARAIANRMKELSGVAVIVENKPGALTNIAAEHVANARPNGYTLFITAGNSTFAVNMGLFKKLPFDPYKSFSYVTTLTRVPFVLMVSPKEKIFTVQDLTRVLREKKSKGSYGSSTPISQLISELYRTTMGLETVQIPYKSMEPAWPELNNGGIDFIFSDPANAGLVMRQGRARGIAVTSAQRSPLLPDIPTMIEGGVPDYDITSWLAVYAPAGTPRPVIDKLSGWFNQIMAMDDFKKAMAQINYELYPGTPESLEKFHIAEIEKWGRLIKSARIEPQ
jgi:tripartite-type tricarboxylate transporter receptor subunit TctC